MLRHKIQLFITALLLCLSTVSMAQTISPYSQYGLGDQRSSAFSINRAMGGISAGFTDSRNINYTNPASYASINYTVLDIGANLNGAVYSDSSGRIMDAANGGVSHIAMAFPAKLNRWGFSFGLLPYSNVNYKFDSQITEGEVSYLNKNNGTGSIYQFYIGNGVRFGDFSIGLNAGVLFGELDYTSAAIFDDSLGFQNTVNHSTLGVRDIIFNAGIQYRTKINKLENKTDEKEDIYMTWGLYGAPPLRVKSFGSNYTEATTTSIVTGNEIPLDTASGGVFDQKGNIKLPATLGAGVAFGNENTWTLGADFHYENWKNYENPFSNQLSTVNEWDIKVGGQIIPKYDGDRYGQRIEYRLGAHFGKTKIVLDNNALTDIGMTFGLGIPFKKYPTLKRSLSSLNVSMDIGRRGTIGDNTLKENYYKLTIAYTLSDRWFIKRKFD